MATDAVIGIDLGTTTCCIATVEKGVPLVIANRGYLTTPSVVAITANGQRVVGHAAKRQAVTNAEHTAIAIKRLIGRKWGSDEVIATQKASSCVLVPGPHGDVRVELRGETYSLPELSAMLLLELKIAAETHLNQKVTKAVITVPAYFNDNQRQATRDAGQIAGIEVLRIINEPTAAALAYGVGKQLSRVIVVYDLGGGTFDISIVRVQPNGDFEVLGTGGDTFLGGEDFDLCIVDWFVANIRREHGVDLGQDAVARTRLREAAEIAKRALSATESADVHLPFIATPPGQDAIHLNCTLSRKLFEDISESLVARTIARCDDALAAAKISKESVDDVLLVGGSSRIPAVHDRVTRYFGKKPCQGVHPDEAVAVGAALHAASILEQTDRVRLFDVTPHALGIKMAGNRFKAIVPQNTRVPTSATLSVTTSRDYQSQLRVVVMQGQSEDAVENVLLGEFMMTGLRSALAFEVHVDVAFALDEDGIVKVTATDHETGQNHSIEVSATSGLTSTEIDEMAGDAADFMAEALAAEALRTASQALQTVVAETQRTCEKANRVLKPDDFRRDVLTKAQAGLGKAKMALAGSDVAAIRSAAEELTRRHSTLKALKV
jgi:molecular chaperone DnaK